MSELSTIEEQLEENSLWLFQTVGDSMEPLLHNRESTVQIVAGNRDLQRYDVVLFRRPDGTYVLHRIRRIHRDYLYVCGDNCVGLEQISRSWVLGKMNGFFPSIEPAFVDCNDLEYQEYLKTLRYRYLKLFVQKMPERIRRKIKLFQTRRKAGKQ